MRRERVLLSVALLAFAAAGPAALAASTPKWQGKAPQLEDIFGSRLDRLAPACPSSHARAILAVASNENVALFNMFIRSWRTHSPRTHMVLFTHHPGLAAVNDPPYINVVLFNYTAGFGGDGTSNVFRVFVLFHFLEVRVHSCVCAVRPSRLPQHAAPCSTGLPASAAAAACSSAPNGA